MAVLVPVAVVVLTALILTVACVCHWRNKCAFLYLLTSPKRAISPLVTFCSPYRKKSAEGTYDIPYWDRTGMSPLCHFEPRVWLYCSSSTHYWCAAVWWKSMKQLLPSKMMETEDSVRYSTPEVSRLAGRSAVPRLHAEPAGTPCLLQGKTKSDPF